jgi:peptidoglycan/LPS O-acetylase OafA/YrhL
MTLSLFELSASRVAFHPHFPNRSFVYWTAFLCVALFGLILYTISFRGFLQYCFSTAPLRWLGNMSYTYFLCHGIVLNSVAYFLRGVLKPELSPIAFVVLLFVNLGLTVAGSLVLFLLVEKPFSLAIPHSRVSGVVTAQHVASDPPEERSALSAKR